MGERFIKFDFIYLLFATFESDSAPGSGVKKSGESQCLSSEIRFTALPRGSTNRNSLKIMALG